MTTFNRVFGNTPIEPASSSYSVVQFSANVVLQWPREAMQESAALVIASSIMDCIPSIAALSINLPPANQVSKGETLIFNNLGSQSFFVNLNSGVGAATVAVGNSFIFYVIDNGSADGDWGTIQIGAVPATPVASALAGDGLKVKGSTLAVAFRTSDRPTTGYTVGEADRAHTQRWTGGVGTINLLDPTTMANDFWIPFRNDGSGVLTLLPAAGLINGVASVTVQPGGSGFVFCDGTRYYTIGVGTSSTVGFDYTSIAVPGAAGDHVLAGAELNRIAYKFTGVLTGNRGIVVPNTVQQYWVDNSTTGAFTLTVKTAAGGAVIVTQGQRAILYCNGADVIDADTQGIASPVAIVDGGTGANTASGARTNLGSTAVGDAVFTAATAAAARAALGSTATGDAVFTAATAAAARTTLTLGNAQDAAWTVQQSIIIGGLGATLLLSSTDAGAAEAVAADLYRNSATPANNDILMSLLFSGNSVTPNKRTFAKIYATARDVTNAAELGRLSIGVMGAAVAGTVGDVLIMGPGVQIGPAPTGGDKGAGTLNIQSGVYSNGAQAFPFTALPTFPAVDSTADLEIVWDNSLGQYKQKPFKRSNWQFSSEISATLVNTAVLTQVMSAPIGAGDIAATGKLRCQLRGSYLNNSGANKTLTLQITSNSATIYQDTTAVIPTSANRRAFLLEFDLCFAGSTVAQSLQGNIVIGNIAAATVGFGDMATNSFLDTSFWGSSGFDATLSNAINVLFQHSAADPNTNITIESFLVEYFA